MIPLHEAMITLAIMLYVSISLGLIIHSSEIPMTKGYRYVAFYILFKWIYYLITFRYKSVHRVYYEEIKRKIDMKSKR
jgi:hypothetical protein